MIAAAIYAAQFAEKIPGIGGTVQGIMDGLFGGAARDEWRTARLKMYQSGVHAGSVTAGRYLYGQQTQNVNEHEQDWYAYAIQQEERDYSTVMAQARALGGLYDADSNIQHGVALIQEELAGKGIRWDGTDSTTLIPPTGTQLGVDLGTGVNNVVNSARTEAADAVAHYGTGLSLEAASAIGPTGNVYTKALTFAKSNPLLTVAGVATAALIVYLAIRKK
jgi:hypothetical protein